MEQNFYLHFDQPMILGNQLPLLLCLAQFEMLAPVDLPVCLTEGAIDRELDVRGTQIGAGQVHYVRDGEPPVRIREGEGAT